MFVVDNYTNLMKPVSHKHGMPISFPVYASPKLDGFRCGVANCTPYVGKEKSVIVNRAVRALFSRCALNGFDGELLVGSPTAKHAWATTSSLLKSEKPEDSHTTNVNFYVFDLWNMPKVSFHDRLTLLKAKYNSLPDELKACTTLCTQAYMTNMDDVSTYYREMLEEGYEGIMLRRASAYYKFGRSTLVSQELIRLKPKEDAEFEIVGFNELISDGSPANTLGSLTVAKGSMSFDVGTGFNVNQRKAIWENRCKFLHKTVTVSHSGIVGKKPRNPVFLRLYQPSLDLQSCLDSELVELT